MSRTSHRQKGRFAEGNSGGPGNPYFRQVAAYRKSLAAAEEPEDFKRKMREFYEKAIAGDVAAAQVYLEAYFDAVNNQ